jgi:hypothetical protein
MGSGLLQDHPAAGVTETKEVPSGTLSVKVAITELSGPVLKTWIV